MFIKKDIKFTFGLSIFICFMLAGCSPLDLTPVEIPTLQTKPINTTSSKTKKTFVEPIVMATSAFPQITITGMFTTIWNGDPHYSITDDQGEETKLLLEDEIARPLGGPLELDRKLVTIVGELVSDSPRTVQVLSVQLEDSN